MGKCCKGERKNGRALVRVSEAKKRRIKRLVKTRASESVSCLIIHFMEIAEASSAGGSSIFGEKFRAADLDADKSN